MINQEGITLNTHQKLGALQMSSFQGQMKRLIGHNIALLFRVRKANLCPVRNQKLQQLVVASLGSQVNGCVAIVIL